MVQGSSAGASHPPCERVSAPSNRLDEAVLVAVEKLLDGTMAGSTFSDSIEHFDGLRPNPT